MSLNAIGVYKWSSAKVTSLVAGLIVATGIVYALASQDVFKVTSVSNSITATSTEDELANGNTKTCAGVEVTSIGVSTEFNKSERPFDSSPPTTIVQKVIGRSATIVAVGPVLGSMDSPKVKTELACTGKGFALGVIITRSADYEGAVAKNVLWRPRITIAVKLREPVPDFELIWKMRLTSGVEQDYAQTPPYPGQKYPITISEIIR